MKNVAELITLGKVPADTVGAQAVAGYPDGWPIFSDLNLQVKYDWDNLPSDRVRTLKGNKAYADALNGFLLEPAEKVTPAVPEGQTQSLAKSPEEMLEEAHAESIPAPTGEANTEPVLAIETPVTVPSVEAPSSEIAVGTVVDGFTKTSTGWEIRIEIEGAGVQVFRGKTMGEVAQALAKAQIHASILIRKQQQEKEQMLLNEPADIAVERKVFKPRKMTAEEQFEYAEAMSSGDPVKINKAAAKREQIIMGGDPEEVLAQITEHQQQLERETYMATAKAFLKQNPDIVMTHELGDMIDEIILGRKWAYTVRNMNKALAELKAENKVELRVSTPVEEEVTLPVPTSAVPAAPVVVPAAPAVAPAAAVPAVPKAPVLTDGERLRPGSASTGMSPRQASVRQGTGTPSTKTVGLTAEEYNRMSVNETKRKYKTDLGFRAAVDKLIEEGKI
jgi:hypothetical protein